MSPYQVHFLVKEKMDQVLGKPRGLTGRKGTKSDAYAMFGGLLSKGFAIEREQVPVSGQ